MRLHQLLFAAGLACALTACQGTQGPSAGTAQKSTPAEMGKSPSVPAAVLRHMHMHAAQLDQLNVALRAGNLEAAGTPAYWLSKHDTVSDLPKGWRPYVEQMRAEAKAVDVATDLATARAAAARLSDTCNACHLANGKSITLRR